MGRKVSMKLFSAIVLNLFVFYMIWSCYRLYYPEPCTTAKCWHPSWDNSTRFDMTAFVSTEKKLGSKGKVNAIWFKKQFNLSVSSAVQVEVELPYETRQNGSLYLHLLLMDEIYGNDKHGLSSLSHYYSDATSAISAPLTKFNLPRSAFLQPQSADTKSGSRSKANRPTTHWIPHLTVQVMSEPVSVSNIIQEMGPFIRLNYKNQYLPMIRIDTFGLSEKDYLEINSNIVRVPLKLTFTPLTLGKMNLLLKLHSLPKLLQTVGIIEDTYSIKDNFDIYFTFLSIMAFFFLILLDILSLENDIHFWRNHQTNVGISIRSLVCKSICQMIIFLYSYSQVGSLFFLTQEGLLLILELWKLLKALKLKIEWIRWGFRFEIGSSTEEEQLSDMYDSQGMKYLLWAVTSCCACYATYSLYFVQPVSWSIWCLESAFNGMYMFGFIFMLPQVFLNYKLKSVAHLPWKSLKYKGLEILTHNFISFTTTIPLEQHAIFFRHDIAFIIYSCQQLKYPVYSQDPPVGASDDKGDEQKEKGD